MYAHKTVFAEKMLRETLLLLFRCYTIGCACVSLLTKLVAFQLKQYYLLSATFHLCERFSPADAFRGVSVAGVFQCWETPGVAGTPKWWSWTRGIESTPRWTLTGPWPWSTRASLPTKWRP